jgi:phenylpropionate dioxygenase-like ring-hydroxylating dioxygenase large terminal subunit
MAMPTDEVLAERLLTHLQDDTSDMAAELIRVPVRHYFDPEHAEAEREVYRSHPLVVGHSSALPEAGSFVTLAVLGVPLLLVRQDDRSVKAFRNVCRHRGGRVEPEAQGTKRVFTCRYHGWSYNRDGELRGIPFDEGFVGLDRSCSGLVPVAADERHGLLWVRVGSTDDIDVAGFLGPTVDEQLDSLGLANLQLQIEADFEQPVNWKLIAEGNLDVLHPKFLHPTSVGKLIQSRTHVWEPYGRHARHAMARRKLDLIRDDVPEGEDLRPYVITSYFLYPNTWFNVQPSHIEWWSLQPHPMSPTQTSIKIRYLTPQEPTEAEQQSIDQSWEILRTIVPTEDWVMARWIQEGAPHSGTESFVIGANETPIQHLHRRLADDIASQSGRGEPL